MKHKTSNNPLPANDGNVLVSSSALDYLKMKCERSITEANNWLNSKMITQNYYDHYTKAARRIIAEHGW